MFKKQGVIVELTESRNFPGFELIAEENVIIHSLLSNPFFRGFNFLALSKKIKGLKENNDLKKAFEPIIIKTGIKADFKKNQYIIFIPKTNFSDEKRLLNIDNIYGPLDMIEPKFVNFGLKDIKIHKGELLGVIMIQSVENNNG